MKKRILNQNIFYCEDFEKSWAKEELVGRKGLSLLELRDMDVPVPDFFVINPRVFRDISTRGLERVSDKLLEKGRNPEEDEIYSAISNTAFTREVEDEILSAYTRISGFSDAWVSFSAQTFHPNFLR